jgi:ribonucleoside-diphosphate reductase alpha chain
MMNEAYTASAHLAREKGAFPLFDKEKYLAGQFVKGLRPEVRELITKHGLRNSHLLSIQPTGNSSVVANNVSGGLEPIFMTQYIRTSMQPYPPEGLGVPKDVNWESKSFAVSGPPTEWTWAKEGDENVLVTKFNGEVWKFDHARGLLKESRVRDYVVRFHEENGSWDMNADWAATTRDLKIDEHVKTMEVFARYIDSSMSKTVNLPANYPFEEFKSLYMDVFKTGTIKGCTSYREGTMTAVLATESASAAAEKGVRRTKATPRPESLDCDIHHLTSAGDKWVVMVGKLDGDPYEVFAMKQSRLFLPPNVRVGKLIKTKSKAYNLETEDGWVLGDIVTLFESNEQEALTRMISTALRHGADIEFIVSQLAKSEGVITSFSKAIARTLKRYLPEGAVANRCRDCQSSNVKLQEGCYVCMDCGGSKCE